MWISNVEKEGKRYFNGRYYHEKEAAIASDHKQYEMYGDKAIYNLCWSTINDLIAEYTRILNKYGENTSERITIFHQGVKQNKVHKSSSKYVGVSFNKRKNKWAAEISKDKKKYFLGYHDQGIDAAKAYDKKALVLYGENAKLNLMF